MESLLNITLGTIPLGVVVVVIGLLNRQAIKHLNQRVERLEGGYNHHVQYHLKGGGEKG
jgi:hypothetical protein